MKTLLIICLLCCGFSMGCGAGDPGVPAAKPEGHNHEKAQAGLELSAQSQKEAGIKTEVLRQVAVPETFQALGRVMQDSQKSYHATAGCAGTVEKVPVSLGQAVKAGEQLARLRTLSGKEAVVVAEHGGIVTALHASDGERVNELSFIATVTDIDPLWGVIDVPERSMGLIRKGQRVKIRTEAYRGRIFPGEVSFISPEIDPDSRTVKVRVAINNPDGLLKFGMFIDCDIVTGEAFRALMVAADAVQSRGDGRFVFVRKSGTSFEARPVVTGREKDGLVELLSGVSPGEAVVTSGAYMLKSELMKSQLEGDDHA